MAKSVAHVITGTHSLPIIFTGNYCTGNKPGLGANLGNAMLIGVCKLSSNVGSFKFLSNNLISVIKETFSEQLSDCWVVTLSFMVQTFALLIFPDMLCVSPATNLASPLNMVFNSALHFLPDRRPQDWSSSSTFQTAFLRLSITCGTGNLSLWEKRDNAQKLVYLFLNLVLSQLQDHLTELKKQDRRWRTLPSLEYSWMLMECISGETLSLKALHGTQQSSDLSQCGWGLIFKDNHFCSHTPHSSGECVAMPLLPLPTRNQKPLTRLWQSDKIKAQAQIDYSQSETCLGRWVQTAEVCWPCSGLVWQEPALLWRQPSTAFHAASIVFCLALGEAGQPLREAVSASQGGQRWLKCAFMGAGEGQLRSVCTCSQQMQEKSQRDLSFMAPGLQSFPPKLTVAFLCSRAQQGGCVVHESTECCSPPDSSSKGVPTFLLARRDWFGTTQHKP